MRLVVTGAGGMLGCDVLRVAARAGHDVTALTRAELDVTDAAATTGAITRAAPDVVVNCAAWTDVDGAEAQEAAALAVNGTGAGNVAVAAGLGGATVVQVSTDYVFDGAKRTPYVESDATGPVGAYGRTKLAGERAVAAAGGRHAIVRTAWLFGRGGPNFVDTMLRLGRERDEVSVVTDQIGSPTWTGDLARALVSIAERETTGILHAAGSGSCSWFDFAREIFALTGVDCTVKATTTEAFPRPAPRPPWSVLGTERTDVPVLPSWQAGLSGYLTELSGRAAGDQAAAPPGAAQTTTTNGARA